MTSRLDKLIEVDVDVTNPGQFFACCGLLELVHCLSQGSRGWFESGMFMIQSNTSLPEVIDALCSAEIYKMDSNDNTASPLIISHPFDLQLDWWKSSERSVTDLKLWAGTMDSYRIAVAMQSAMKDESFRTSKIFNIGCVVYNPEDITKKVEPYYFDARRCPNAHSRDIGFAPNDLGLTTTAFPSVELLCLIGLQRAKPFPVPDQPRIYDYHLWNIPLEPLLLPVAVSGMFSSFEGYRFESCYRTGQKKHKAFKSANPKPKES